ncbi:MAG: hypothetical protein VB144_14425 [Clostridia bacterium]|nr:hypothetical protein [Clostridia bacterium]
MRTKLKVATLVSFLAALTIISVPSVSLAAPLIATMKDGTYSVFDIPVDESQVKTVIFGSGGRKGWPRAG